MPTETHKIRNLWSVKIDSTFNSFAVAHVFKYVFYYYLFLG